MAALGKNKFYHEGHEEHEERKNIIFFKIRVLRGFIKLLLFYDLTTKSIC